MLKLMKEGMEMLADIIISFNFYLSNYITKEWTDQNEILASDNSASATMQALNQRKKSNFSVI